MAFGNPLALLLLALVAIPLILSFFRIKPIPVLMSSLQIWNKIKDRNPPIKEARQPKLSFSVILQILGVIFAVLALSAPRIYQTIPQPLHLYLVIDTSISMDTRFKHTTRLGYAIEMSEKLLGKLESGDKVTLITLHQPSITGSTDEILDHIKNLKAVCAKTDIQAISDQIKDPTGQIVVLSDLPVDKGGQKLPNSTILSGKSENIGIVHFSIEEGDQITLFAKILNLSPGIKIPIQLVLDDKKIEPDFIIDSKAKFATFVHKLKDKPRKIEITITKQDNFPHDNKVVAQRLDGKMLNACLVGSNNYLLKAIEATGIPIKEEDPAKTHSVAIYYKTMPSNFTSAYSCIVDPEPKSENPLNLKIGKTYQPNIMSASHELFQFVKLDGSDLKVREINMKDMTPVLYADNKVVAALDSTGKILVLGLDITNWQKLAAPFTVFWANYVNHIRREMKISAGYQIVKAGEPVTLSSGPSFIPTRPGGFTHEDITLYANLLDVHESDNEGEESLALDLNRNQGYINQLIEMNSYLVIAFLASLLLSWLFER